MAGAGLAVGERKPEEVSIRGRPYWPKAQPPARAKGLKKLIQKKEQQAAYLAQKKLGQLKIQQN